MPRGVSTNPGATALQRYFLSHLGSDVFVRLMTPALLAPYNVPLASASKSAYGSYVDNVSAAIGSHDRDDLLRDFMVQQRFKWNTYVKVIDIQLLDIGSRLGSVPLTLLISTSYSLIFIHRKINQFFNSGVRWLWKNRHSCRPLHGSKFVGKLFAFSEWSAMTTLPSEQCGVWCFANTAAPVFPLLYFRICSYIGNLIVTFY